MLSTVSLIRKFWSLETKNDHRLLIINKSRRREIVDFTNMPHHKSNAHKRRIEGLDGKNRIALDMVQRALNNGIDADYLLVDS